ncbi:MAG TPA: ABC transporter substrate-binding protein [Acidimicrobiales bacterium]|nr:ABC transporter substrate-binding protein [Acidimicrobiales bacterium]
MAAAIGLFGAVVAPLSVQATSAPKLVKHTEPEINLVEAGSIPGRLSVYVALYNRLFQRFGLDVHLVEASSGTQAASLLSGGAAQFEAGQVSDALNQVVAGVPITAIASMSNRISNSMIVSPTLQSDLNSKGLAALANVPIGITGVGSGTWEYAELLAKQANLSTSQINLVPIGANQVTVYQDFVSGRVKGLVFGDPVDLELTGTGQAIWAADEQNVSHGVAKKYPTLVKMAKEPYIFDWCFTTTSYAHSHPVIVQDFANAIIAAQNYILHHSAAKIGSELAQNNPSFSAFGSGYLTESVKRMVKSGAIVSSVIPTKAGFSNAVAYQAVTDPALSKIPYSQVVNASYAIKAKKIVGNKS